MNFMSDPQKTGMNIFNTQYTVHVRWLVAMYSLPLNKAVLLKRFYVPSKIKQSHRKGKKKKWGGKSTSSDSCCDYTDNNTLNKNSRKLLKQTEHTR